ncbi:MAG: division/cell wall cluster transcriptional repressor MraZ [Lachnospiraceae bacterium]|nr:division/cell wall cluster transcriptional repressor MraZ [Lachnospiraceae bacterium]
MFTGVYNHTIDQKGCMIIPNKFRNLLGDSFIITKGIDDCLEIYDMNSWNSFSEKINSLPYSSKNAREFKRVFIGNAIELVPDKMGRVQLTPALRTVAKLKQDVTFLGVGDHIEVWDATINKEKNNFEDEEEMSKKMEGLGI